MTYLVANLALLDGVSAAAEQYDIGLSEVYSALTFYYDNQAQIEARRAEQKSLIAEVSVDADMYLEVLRQRNRSNQ